MARSLVMACWYPFGKCDCADKRNQENVRRLMTSLDFYQKLLDMGQIDPDEAKKKIKAVKEELEKRL